MNKKEKSMIVSNIGFFVLIGLIGVTVYATLPAAQISPYQDKLDDITEQSIELLNEMNKYLTTIAFVIVGVLGNIMMGKLRIKRMENYFTMTLFFSSLSLSLVSIFYSYLSYSKLFETVSYHKMDVHDPQISWAQNMQFITLLLSALLFSWYLFSSYLSKLKIEG